MKIRALAAEAIGTFILVGFGSMSIIGANGGGAPPILVVPFGFGFALLAGIVLFGHISGAHFNPAVTLAAFIDRRIDLVGSIGYVVAQAVGAAAASLAILVLFGKEIADFTRNTPASVLNDAQVFAIETVLTTIFVAVILSITARSASQAVFVIPITLLMIHFVAVPISGASVNPIRSIAPAVAVGNYQHLWAYIAGPFLGAVIGWGLYRLMGNDQPEDAPEPDEIEDGEFDGDDAV
jgi:MIP family channel proteins